jgi:hypothetical protein
MKSINFNTGIKQYAVNGDEGNPVSINISDLNLYKRIRDSENAFDPILAKLDAEENTPELFAEVDKAVKDKLDYIFDTNISEKVFGETNCLSPLEDGNLLFMAFLDAFVPVVLEDMGKAKQSFNEGKNEKFSKYLPKEEKKPLPNLSKLTPEQLAFLESIGS